MRWEDFRRSENIEDRREEGGGYGGGFGMPVGAGGLSIGTVVVLGLIGWALGIDPRLLIGGAEILRPPMTDRRVAIPGPPARRAIRRANSSPPSSATARIAGRRSSRRAIKPTARRSS